MKYLDAALFRVRLEIIDAKELVQRPAVAGPFHMTLYVAASDAEAAARAACRAVQERDGYDLRCVRAVSVRFVERVNVLAMDPRVG